MGRLWAAPIGKKAIMALTGVVLYGFVLAHMLGNLQFHIGQPLFDAYAEHLKEVPALIWTLRVVLLVSVILHIAAAISLSMDKGRARPEGYRRLGKVRSTYASRTMMLGGILLLVFVVFHIMELTTGNALRGFVPGAAYHNVVILFANPAYAIAYIVAMIALCFHLYHGVWSSFQSLGLGHPRYSGKLRLFAKAYALIVMLGFISLPIAVMLGAGKQVLP
jgi:succinate dehydrogenase / fumarate reductase cytochrome b subunit